MTKHASKKIAVVTLFPEMFTALTEYGVSSRAIKQGLLDIYFSNPRDFTEDRHQTVDDRPYGGGPGMVMKVAPLKAAIDDAKAWLDRVEEGIEPIVIYLSPQGRLFNQEGARTLALGKAYQHIILVAGRYEGIDERLLEAEVDEEWSIGDYVLSGGEFPAMVMMDALIRLLPTALGHQESAEQDSFSDGLLDCPHYTRPEVYDQSSVPAVLLSGNHSQIAQWRLQQSLGRTWLRRPELLENIELTAEQATLLEAFKATQAASDNTSDN